MISLVKTEESDLEEALLKSTLEVIGEVALEKPICRKDLWDLRNKIEYSKFPLLRDWVCPTKGCESILRTVNEKGFCSTCNTAYKVITY